MLRTFNQVSISQTATILALDLGGGTLPSELFKAFTEWAIVIPALVTTGFCTSSYLESRGKGVAALVPLWIVFLGMIPFVMKVNFGFFKPNAGPPQTGSNIFDQYQYPSVPKLPPGRPLNVIWIFVESLERDYTAPEMNAELEKATSFMTPLAVSPLLNRYTVGAVMSAKCGAPVYFTVALVNHLHYAGFNNATCFDDVLRDNGYSSYFVVGHDATLSGFRKYYKKHADAAIYDAVYLKSQGVASGSKFPTYPDEKVFETALGILNSPTLKKPYSLNILTLDNHAPSGFPSNACVSQYGTSMANVIRCDNHSLAQFIEELKRSGRLQDTVLVVEGDHPFMGAFDELSTDRYIFAKIYTPLPGKKVLDDTPSPFDFFPSVLSAMDFSVGDRQFGFGYSFYDAGAYPVRDWKSRLETFATSTPTPLYKALNR